MASACAPRDGHVGSDLSQFHDEFTDIKHSLSHGDAKVCAAGAAKLCALCSDRATASAWLEFLATQRALGTCLDLLGRRLASAPTCAEALLRLSLGCLCVPSTVDVLDHAACRGITAGLIGLGCTTTIRTFEVESSAGQGATGSLSPVRPAGTTLASRIRRRGARITSSAAETGKSTQVPYSHVHVPARTVGNAARSSFAAHGIPAFPELPGSGMPLHTSSAWPGLAMLAALCRDFDQCTTQDVLVCLLWQALCVESGHEHAAAEAMRLRWRPSTLAGSSTTGVPDSPSAPSSQHGADAAASQACASTSGTASRSISGQRRCRLLRAAVAQLHVERLLLHYAQEHLLCCMDGASDTARARSARVLPVLLAMLDSAVFEQHDAQSALLAASCARDATWSVDVHSGKASVLPGAIAPPVSALQVACAAALHAWQAPAHSPFHRTGVASDVQFCALKLMTSLCHNAASASRQLREQSALWWAAGEEPATHGTPSHTLTLAVATTLLALQHLQSVVGAVTSSAQAASEHPQFDTALCCCGLLTNALEHDAQLASALGSASVHAACAQLCRVLPRDPTSLVAGLAAKPSCVSALAREFGTLYGHAGLPIQAIRSAPPSATSSLATLPDMPSHGLEESASGADDTVRPDVLILLGYLAVLLCHIVVRDAGPRAAVVRGIALRMPHALIQHSTCDTARVEIAALLTALKAFVNVQATLGVLRSAEAQALLMLKQDVELACLASTQRNGHGHAEPRGDTARGAQGPAARAEPVSAPSMPRAFNSLKRRRFGGSAPLEGGAVLGSSPAPARHSLVLDGAALARAAVKSTPVPGQRVTSVASTAPSVAGLHRGRVGYANRHR